MAEAAASAWPPVTQDKPPAHVLNIAAAFVIAADRDGYEMFVAKLHFLCYQLQGWTLALTGRRAFAQMIHAVADGVRIDEISTAYAPFGDRIFTLQDAIDAGIICAPDAEVAGTGAHEIQQ
jgi:hypothetical protein